MVITDPDGVITSWNRGAELVMGWISGEMAFTGRQNDEPDIHVSLDAYLTSKRA